MILAHTLRNGGLSRRGFLRALGVTTAVLLVPGLASVDAGTGGFWIPGVVRADFKANQAVLAFNGTGILHIMGRREDGAWELIRTMERPKVRLIHELQRRHQ